MLQARSGNLFYDNEINMGTISNNQPKKPQLKLDKLWEQEVQYECIHFKYHKKITHSPFGSMQFYGSGHNYITNI